MEFIDRNDAGRRLAEVINVEDSYNTVILALPRGGIPLAIEISRKLGAVMDVIIAKKIAHPYQREYAIGAMAEKGEPMFNEREKERIDPDWLVEEISRVKLEIQSRRKFYDPLLTQQTLEGKDILIVDDGIATGLTMFAAIKALEEAKPHSVAVAVPIIPKDTYDVLEKLVDKVFYNEVPERFLGSVGAYYQQFPQLTNDEIRMMLADYNQ